MSSTQFWTGILVTPFIKWVQPRLQRLFKLTEIDSETKTRVFAKQYPAYFSLLYSMWIIALLSTGFIVLLWFIISGSVFLGLINMIGVWFIGGAMLNFVFWQVSSESFKDYVRFRQIKSGWGYDMKQQIQVLFKIGFVYYLVVSPAIVYLLVN